MEMEQKQEGPAVTTSALLWGILERMGLCPASAAEAGDWDVQISRIVRMVTGLDTTHLATLAEIAGWLRLHQSELEAAEDAALVEDAAPAEAPTWQPYIQAIAAKAGGALWPLIAFKRLLALTEDSSNSEEPERQALQAWALQMIEAGIAETQAPY